MGKCARDGSKHVGVQPVSSTPSDGFKELATDFPQAYRFLGRRPEWRAARPSLPGNEAPKHAIAASASSLREPQGRGALLTLKRSRHQNPIVRNTWQLVTNCNGSLHPHPRVTAVAKKTATAAPLALSLVRERGLRTAANERKIRAATVRERSVGSKDKHRSPTRPGSGSFDYYPDGTVDCVPLGAMGWAHCPAGVCEWVTDAQARASRDGMILITGPAATVAKPLSCRAASKMQ